MDIMENNSFETYSIWHDVDEVKPDDGQWVLGVNRNQVYTCKFDGEYFKQQINKKRGVYMYNYSINWVSGYDGAKQFPLNRNGAVVLLDNDTNKMYIKTCDNIGMCDIRCFELKEVTAQKHDDKNYITREEFQHLHEDVDKLIMKIEEWKDGHSTDFKEQSTSTYGQGC